MAAPRSSPIVGPAGPGVRVEDGAVDGTVRVLLDRPPVNAFDLAQYVRLTNAIAEIAADPPRCVLLGSALPRYFSAGRDLREPPPIGDDAIRHRHATILRLYRVLLGLSCPLIGVLDGYALGAGLVVASLCDMRVASHRTMIGLPEVAAGSVGGARVLLRALPAPTVRRMALTAEHLPADRARELGFVERTVGDDEVWDAAEELAATIAALPPASVALVKRTFDATAEMPLEAAVAAELAGASYLTVGDDG